MMENRSGIILLIWSHERRASHLREGGKIISLWRFHFCHFQRKTSANSLSVASHRIFFSLFEIGIQPRRESRKFNYSIRAHCSRDFKIIHRHRHCIRVHGRVEVARAVKLIVTVCVAISPPIQVSARKKMWFHCENWKKESSGWKFNRAHRIESFSSGCAGASHVSSDWRFATNSKKCKMRLDRTKKRNTTQRRYLHNGPPK